MPRKFTFLFLSALLAVSTVAQARMDELKEPSVAFPEGFSKADREAFENALKPKDAAKFISGRGLNSFTSLNYAGDTKALNLFMERLADCHGISLSVSFSAEKGVDGSDWQVTHQAGIPRKFDVRINLKSTNIKLESLVIPEIHNPLAAAAVSTDEEARFLGAVQKAFDSRSPAELSELTYWEGIPEKDKKSLEESYTGLVGEKDCKFEFKLVSPEWGFVDRGHQADGATLRPNLTITHQLNMTCHGAKNNKILMRICQAVGVKEGKLYIVPIVPIDESDTSKGSNSKTSELDQKQVEAVLHYAEAGELENLRAMIEKNRDLVNAVLEYNPHRKPSAGDTFTPLHYAALYGHKETAEYLLSQGAKVNAVNETDCTPLHLAASAGHPETVAMLIDKGADVNAKEKNGGTPLISAAQNGHLDVAKLLVSHRADLKAKSDAIPASDGYAPGMSSNAKPKPIPAIPSRTALEWAAAEHHNDLVAYLKSAAK